MRPSRRPPVACALAAFLFVLSGWAPDFWLAFRQRVLANVFAIMTIPPLIVLAAAGELVGLPKPPRYVELGFVTMGLLAVSMLAFGWAALTSAHMPALVLAPLPLLLWSGPFRDWRVMSFPPRGCGSVAVEHLCGTRSLRQQLAGREHFVAPDLFARDVGPTDDSGAPCRGAPPP